MKNEIAEIIELATGSTTSSDLESGVNKALEDISKQVFEIKDVWANFRKWAARVEYTDSHEFDIEKFAIQQYSTGGQIDNGENPTFTKIDNQSLIQFTTPTYFSYGIELTRRVLKQARADPRSFMDRYKKGIARQLAIQEDIYVSSILQTSPTNIKYGGDATAQNELTAGDVMTIEMFEKGLDTMKENNYMPTDLLVPSKVSGQLRRDARLLNNSDFNLAIKEDGTLVTQIGDVKIHEVPGTRIFPEYTGSGATAIVNAYLISKPSCYAIVDFTKLHIAVGTPDITLAGATNHRIVGEMELESQVLDQSALVEFKVANV